MPLQHDPDQRRSPRAEAIVVSANGLPTTSDADFVVEPYTETSELVRRWLVLRRYAPQLLAAAMLGVAAAWFLRGDPAKVYSATATVRFQDTRANLTSGVGNEASQDYRIDPVSTQSELLNTRATRARAVDSANLEVRAVGAASITWLSEIDASQVPAADTLRLAFSAAGVGAKFGARTTTAPYGGRVLFPGLSFNVPAKPQADSAKFFVSTREEAIVAAGGVTVTRRPETDIADFSLTGSDPIFVQRALNAMTLALEAISQSSDQQTARSRRRFLDEQMRRTDSILEVQRAQLSAFRAQTQTFDAAQRGIQEQQTIANLRARREELSADRQVFASLLPAATAARKEGDPSKLKSLIGAPGITSNSIIADLYSQLQRLSLRKDSLTKGPFASAASNPDVERLNAQIESVTDEFISAVQSNIGTYDARIAALDGLMTKTAQEASSLPATQSEEERLRQDAQSTQRLSDQLHDEQQRARISEAAQGSKIEIIDLARAPGAAVAVSPVRKLLLGGLLGLAVAMILIFLYEELNTSLRRKGDVERLLSLPTLGSIPALSHDDRGKTQKLLGKFSKPATVKSGALVPVTSTPVFESYRAIRTSLIFSHAVDSLRSIAITSAAPGDGKSTTVANLAIAFAQQNLRVLIIDCDLRRGSLHRIFGIPRSPGFTNAVADGSDLQTVVRETAVPNLFIVTTGVQPPNPGELLGSHRVHDLLIQAQTQFDLILIDTPPVLAAADAGIIASMVDGVILLIRVGVTTKSAAKTAQERLKLVGARILGTVLNDPKEMLEATEEYYYYDYTSPKAGA